MALGSEQRRAERRPRVAAQFAAEQVEAALDLLALADMAWHDCYGPRELAVPDRVLDDVLVVGGGDLAALVRAARLAVADFRDIRLWADELRGRAGSG
ncbi:hypothetical protein [Actinoplanes sp. URMC 104]|uniref:hypothetical protein n=1 Tax=Actinoplanes sp. URMC 104 TaxID=3423409 RepID=UPI003F1D5837